MIWGMSIKNRNTLMKATHANGKRAVDIIHWNLGAKKWENKTTEILALIDKFNPDFCFFSEANLSSGLEDYLTVIPGYDLITSKSHSTVGYSRLVLLAKEGAQFTVDQNRMSEEVTSIWIKVGGRGPNSTLIGGVYREQSLIYPIAPQNSESEFEMEEVCKPVEKCSKCQIVLGNW